VVITARRLERLEDLAGEIEREGGEVLPVQADVTKLEQVQDLVQTAYQRFGRIDVLFNNAGFGRLDWLENLDPVKDVKAQIEVNLLGLVWTAQAVLPIMITQRSGHIINMASMAGFRGNSDLYDLCRNQVRRARLFRSSQARSPHTRHPGVGTLPGRSKNRIQ
jgi:NADP-dependent 3-hydroxy acid dehydrogenase YdfG